LIIMHVVESFSAGTFDFIVDLINGMNQYDHLIVHGYKSDTPQNFKKYFPQNTKFILWEDVGREINLKKDIMAFLQLLKIIKTVNGIDVVHLHSAKAGFLGRLGMRLTGNVRKVVYTTHAAPFLRKDVSKIVSQIFIRLEQLGMLLGGRVVTCSESELLEHKKHRINATCINNGVHLDRLTLSTFTSNVITIGTVGRISLQKNPKLFNQVASHFVGNSGIRFIWIGDGECRSELTSQNIDVSGWLSHDEAVLRMNELSLYLSTSLWEGLPLSVMQAMSLSKPLILNNCTGNRDLVINEVNGFLFSTVSEAIEAINKLISDSDKLIRMGAASKTIICENFSIRTTVQNYLKLYTAVCTK